MIYLPLLISKKFNITFKKNSIAPLVSIISKIGIFVGTFVLIVSFSALNGFQMELNNKILSVFPHGEIFPIHRSFHNWKKIENLLKLSSEIVSITPYVSTTALINHTHGIKGIQLRGLNFNNDHGSNKLFKFINFKTLKNMQKNNSQILIGKNIAKRLSIKKGDWINVIIPNNYNVLTLYPKYLSLQVLDFFQINSSIDDKLVLMSILDLQKHLNMQSNISGLEIFVKHPFDINKTFKEIQTHLSNNFVIKTWIAEYGFIYRDIKLIKTIIYSTMILIIIISCFSIASITLLEVSKKVNSIAILKTLGLDNYIIRIIFLIHGIKSIFKVGMSSLLFSIILLLNFKRLIHYIEKYLDRKILSENIYFIDFIPISVSCVDIISIFCILFLIGCITSYYPAYYASKINPIEILKKY
ncbi:MAG: FtsX-like permease family protein [Buchnera aphidicola (Melaphis rhois)]